MHLAGSPLLTRVQRRAAGRAPTLLEVSLFGCTHSWERGQVGLEEWGLTFSRSCEKSWDGHVASWCRIGPASGLHCVDLIWFPRVRLGDSLHRPALDDLVNERDKVDGVPHFCVQALYDR